MKLVMGFTQQDKNMILFDECQHKGSELKCRLFKIHSVYLSFQYSHALTYLIIDYKAKCKGEIA